MQRLVNMPKPNLFFGHVIAGRGSKGGQACRVSGQNPHHVEAMRLLAQIAAK